jgi:hypothetical protein
VVHLGGPQLPGATARRDAEFDGVLLLGTSTLSGEFATLGAWRRRVHCDTGYLRFEAPERQLVEIESFGELALATAARGSDGLGIGL